MTEDNTVGAADTPQVDPATAIMASIIEQQGEELRRADARIEDLQAGLADKADKQAYEAQSNNAILNVVLDNVAAAISLRMRHLVAEGVDDTKKAHRGVVVDVLAGIHHMDAESLMSFQQFIVRGMAARRQSGIPGTDHVGL